MSRGARRALLASALWGVTLAATGCTSHEDGAAQGTRTTDGGTDGGGTSGGTDGGGGTSGGTDGGGTDGGGTDGGKTPWYQRTVTLPQFGSGFTDLSTALDGAPPAFLATPQPPSGADPEPTVGLFGDIDNDGTTDVLFGATMDGPDGRTTLAYRYDATGGLTLQGPLPVGITSSRLDVASVFDLDDDGVQDLITNRPEAEVVWGLGAGRFETPTSITTHTGQWSLSYSSVLLDDFDDDGWTDVALGVATCCPTCRDAKLLLRNGTRSFVDRTDLIDVAPAGTNIALLRTTMNGEKVFITVVQPCIGEDDAPAFYRPRVVDADGLPHLAPFDPTPTNAYVRVQDAGYDGQVRTLSHWVPMAVAIGDADNDGRIDLAISLNYFVGIFQNPGSFPMVDYSAQFGERPALSDANRRMIPWGLALIDLDQDGRLDLVTAHGNDHSATIDPGFYVGPQYTTIQWNAGGMYFADATTQLGVARRGQWRSLAVGDLDRDGDPDLLIGGQAENPRLLRNDLAGNHGFSLRLHGTTSNSAGIGARVEVQVAAGQPPQVHVVGTVGSPLVFSDPLVFAGLGAATQASLVRVVWPSGVVQELHDVAAGTMHTVEEPALIALTPAGRHLAADGRATATVRVTPRQTDGTLRTDARVEVALAYGGGSITPAHWTGEAWECTVTAPAQAGSSVIEVRVDGTVVGVRPRLWWD